MVSQNYDFLARRLIDDARNRPAFPAVELGIIEWRDNPYFGHIQHVYPQQQEIVNLSKTSRPIPQALADSIKRVEPTILQLKADDFLDLEGRQHILRKLEDRLTIMTPEQTRYAMEHPIRMVEL